MAKPNANAKAANVKALASHNYCAVEDMDTDVKRNKKILSSPAKTNQPQKKIKTNDDDPAETSSDSASITDVLKAIQCQSGEIHALHALVIDIKSDIQQNTIAIANINKCLEFNSAEIQDCKEKNKELQQEINLLKEKNDQLEKKVTEMGKKVSDAASYKKRWNLRLKGLKEDKQENTRELVANLILKLIPQWKDKMGFILDTVHRLGQPTATHPRQIIMQFTMRIYKEEIWKVTKDHKICKELGIRFAQDFTKEELDARAAVWPKVDAARKQGLKAVYRGSHAYINGQRVIP